MTRRVRYARQLATFHGAPDVCGRSDKVRVRIAPAAIACQYVRPAFVNGAILAAPMHIAVTSRGHRAPGGFLGRRRLLAECERCTSSSGEHDADHCLPPVSVLVITPDDPLHSRREHARTSIRSFPDLRRATITESEYNCPGSPLSRGRAVAEGHSECQK